MKRSLVIGLGLLVALGGCRALVGIDDLDYTPARGDGGKDPNKEEGGPPGPGGDSGGPRPGVDSGLVEKCSADLECPKCCKNGSNDFRVAFEGMNAGGQCICKPELGCQARCATAQKTCGAPPDAPGTSAPSDCVKCTDDVIRAGSDPCVEAACGGDPACLEGLRCFQACKP